MEVEPEDDIQDAVPRAAPERLPIPFKYHEPENRPRETVIGLAFLADMVVLLVGGLLSLMIGFQSFSSEGAKTTALADEQISQTLVLGLVAAGILTATAVAAFWARANVTGVIQSVFVVCVLMLTASSMHDLRHSAPMVSSPNVQPTATSTDMSCPTGDENCPGG